MSDDQFPNEPTEPIPAVGGPTDPTQAQPPVTPPDEHPEDGTDGRPAWLVPAGAGLAIGLVIALIAVLLVRGGDDDEAAATSTTVETIATVPETTTAPTTVPATTAPATTAPATTAPATTAPATTAPATTAPATTAPATTAPATTEPAPTTTTPGGLTPASPNMIRIADTEYPIERVCQTVPFEGFTGDYLVESYLYFDEVGAPWVVERWFDEGGASGVYFGDQLEVTDLGADGFGFTFFEGDSEVPAAVNPGSSQPQDCGGNVVEVAANGSQRIYTIVDVCLGNDPVDGTLRYAASLSEQGSLELAPNADASYRAFMISAIGDPFSGADDQATEPGPPAGGRFQVDMLLTQTNNGSEQRTAQADIIEAAVRECA